MKRKDKLPNCLLVREILYTKENVDYLSYGDAYMEKGRLNDALNFYERAMSKENLRKIKSIAVSTGDAFLLGRIARILSDEVTSADWEATGEQALARGKFSFALKAFQAAGNQEKVKQVREIATAHARQSKDVN